MFGFTFASWVPVPRHPPVKPPPQRPALPVLDGRPVPTLPSTWRVPHAASAGQGALQAPATTQDADLLPRRRDVLIAIELSRLTDSNLRPVEARGDASMAADLRTSLQRADARAYVFAYAPLNVGTVQRLLTEGYFEAAACFLPFLSKQGREMLLNWSDFDGAMFACLLGGLERDTIGRFLGTATRLHEETAQRLNEQKITAFAPELGRLNGLCKVMRVNLPKTHP